jgi:hypothetical protein
MSVVDEAVAVMDQAQQAIEQLRKEKAELERALMPFALAYAIAADPIGDSDLDNEQPRHLTVSLGDCRRAAAALSIYPTVKP